MSQNEKAESREFTPEQTAAQTRAAEKDIIAGMKEMDKPFAESEAEQEAFGGDILKGMIEAAKKAFAESEFSKEHKMIEGRIATGDQFISDKEHKAFIAKEFSPACVEMEGAAIAHACYLNTVPFVILRCMSDMADDSGSKVYDFNESTAAEMSARVVEKLICLI